MPQYEFECDQCHSKKTILYDMNDIGKPECCKKPMRRLFSPFRTIVDFRDGFDIGLGKYFDSARQRNNYIAANNISRIR